MAQLPRVDYDPEANALYIQLQFEPYSHGRDVDAERRIDYAADGSAIGVEVTCVRSGVTVDGLPAEQEISRILKQLNIPILARRSQ